MGLTYNFIKERRKEMNTNEDLFHIRYQGDYIVGTKAEVLDFIGKHYVKDSVYLERIYTIPQYDKKEEEGLPF